MPSSHRAILTYDDTDGMWLVGFPALVGCHTYGETRDEARSNAREALQLWLDEDDVEVDEDEPPANG